MSFAKWELFNKPTSKQEDWACSLDDGKKKTGFTILPVPRITSRQLWTMFVVFCCSCLPSEAWTPTTTMVKSASCPSIWETCFDYSHEVHVQDGTDSELRAPQTWTPTVTMAENTNCHSFWDTCFNGSCEVYINGDTHSELRAPQRWSKQATCTAHGMSAAARQHLGCCGGTPDNAQGTGQVIGWRLTTTPSGNAIVYCTAYCQPASPLGASSAQCRGKYGTTPSDNAVLTSSFGCLVESAIGASSAWYDLAHLRQHLDDGGGNYDGVAGKCESMGRLTTTSGNIVLTKGYGCPPESAAGARSTGMSSSTC